MSAIAEKLELAKASKKEIKAIYELVNDEVSNDATLAGLISASKTAYYKLWIYIFSFLSWLQEELWAESKAEIEAIADRGIPGTDRWLANEIKQFQYGDALVFDTDTGTYDYAIDDVAKQIIKRVAVTSNNGVTTVKVAKEDGVGTPIPLVAAEITAFNDFIGNIQWAGTGIKTVSIASDKLDVPATIYFDALITEVVVKAAVEAAILNYLANLKFNGEFSLTKLVDAIQAVAGVEDVVLGTVRARPDSSVFANVDRVYIPNSGYLEIDPATPLNASLTYTPL